jgi:hypothetical protein
VQHSSSQPCLPISALGYGCAESGLISKKGAKLSQSRELPWQSDAQIVREVAPRLLCAFCSVGTVLFTALGISVAAIALHGSFRVPDDLFTDEIEVGPLSAQALRDLDLSRESVLVRESVLAEQV